MNHINFNSLSPAKNAVGNLLDELFNSSVGDFLGADFVNNFPSVNSIETKEDFRIELAAPGVDKKDLKIDIDKNQLTVSTSKEATTESKEEHFKRREFNYSSFSRSFQIPETVNVNDISANHENGVLVITLPKKTEAKEQGSKTIDIE